MNDDFLKEVFKETNAHIRASEQKSLVLTGAFVGFYLNVFIYLLKGQGIVAANVTEPLIVLVFHVLLLFIGTVVYTMQLWYRAWKEHYLTVCFEIRKHFVATLSSESVFPYWLRTQRTENGRFSFDNLVMYVTLLVNLGVLFLIAEDVLGLLKASATVPFTIGDLCLWYVIVVLLIHSRIRSTSFLAA